MNTTNLEVDRVLYWVLNGRLTPDNRLQFIPGLLTEHPPRQSPQEISSPLRIDLLDSRERLLVRQVIPITHYFTDSPHTIKDIPIRAKVPFNQDTKIIRFWNGDVLVQEWQRPNSPPILSDLSIQRSQGLLRLSWHAQHPEGVNIQYAVRFSRNGGGTFNRLSQRLDKPEYEVAEKDIPGGKGWIFQIVATDGINTTTLNSETIDLPETPPLLEIYSPPDNSQISVGQSVLFYGELVSFLGEDVSISSANWISDRDGELSKQSLFTTSQLSPGTHHITLRVLDSLQHQLTATITCHVN